MIANRRRPSRTVSSLVLAALFCFVGARAYAAATIVIVNNDAAGVGFNDPTPVAPVGGNPGTTLGQQRLNVFQAAANVWGANLTSAVTIRVLSSWEPLTCNATQAVLGAAGSIEIFRDFTGAPFAGSWYGKALTAKIFGADPDPATADIRARFNINLGQPGCFTGTFFYLGLDTNHGANVDLMTVLEHELAHGLGFQSFTSGSTGAYLGGFPSAYDRFLLDTTVNLTWDAMTAAQRQASAINTARLVWTGTNVTTAVPSVLSLGRPRLQVTSPASIANLYLTGAAAFGPPLSSPGVTAEVMPYTTQFGETGPGCDPFNAANVAGASGKIMLIDRGVCGFTVKVKNAQNAGAVAVLIGNNAVGSPPPGLGGADPTIVIPAVMISQSDATLFKNTLATRSRSRSGMFANLGVDLSLRAGADASNRALLFTPNPFQQGSSVSHYDTSAFRNLLMEPAINGDLTHSVQPPEDLTLPLLKDLGW